VRATDIPLMVEAGLGYARYRSRRPASTLRQLLDGQGRARLSDTERRLALRADAGMRRLGIACLARSAVVAGMLRRRGVAATVSLSVAAGAPRSAHAEVAVGGQPLRAHPMGNVLFT